MPSDQSGAVASIARPSCWRAPTRRRLRLRDQGSVRTIAFPAISTGVYGFPKAPAAEIALGSMLRHDREFDGITACLFDERSADLYREALARLHARS